jgi:hypothetical protein
MLRRDAMGEREGSHMDAKSRCRTLSDVGGGLVTQSHVELHREQPREVYRCDKDTMLCHRRAKDIGDAESCLWDAVSCLSHAGFSTVVGVIWSNSMNMNTQIHVMSPCHLLLHRHSINHTHGYNPIIN